VVASASVERPHVGVIGPGQADAEVAAAAEAVGRELARRGAVVVCGGLGGTMEAACRGARAAGGTTIGILPTADRAAANAYVEIAIGTGLGELRNGLIVHTADVLIAIGGAFGTLSEIALALRAGKRVIGLGTWELAQAGVPVDAVEIATGARDAVERALAAT
jgi:uncharacterized protein (TIGR00725 family)